MLYSLRHKPNLNLQNNITRRSPSKFSRWNRLLLGGVDGLGLRERADPPRDELLGVRQAGIDHVGRGLHTPLGHQLPQLLHRRHRRRRGAGRGRRHHDQSHARETMVQMFMLLSALAPSRATKNVRTGKLFKVEVSNVTFQKLAYAL